MLKTTKLVVPAALLMCVLAGFMLALGTRADAPVAKVAVVDIEKVVAGLAKRTVKEEELKKKMEDAQKNLTSMEEKIKKINNEISILGDGPEREAKIIESIRMMFNTKNEKDLSEEMLARESGKMRRELYNDIDAAAEYIAKQRGFNLVLVNDENMTIQQPSIEEVNKVLRAKKILYVDPTLDITAEVITYMNNNFNANVSAPATPAPATAGKKGP